jgi:hypothetical protein
MSKKFVNAGQVNHALAGIASTPLESQLPLPPLRLARQRKDALDDSLRPLGPKAAVLHARRHQRKPAKRDCGDGGPAFSLTSHDGAISFQVDRDTPRGRSNAKAALQGIEGLCIRRTQRRPLGHQLIQSLLFEDLAAFTAWCDTDSARFDYPLLHGQLRRHGDEHFSQRG